MEAMGNQDPRISIFPKQVFGIKCQKSFVSTHLDAFSLPTFPKIAKANKICWRHGQPCNSEKNLTTVDGSEIRRSPAKKRYIYYLLFPKFYQVSTGYGLIVL